MGCTCVGEETAKQALKSSDLVVTGKIISKNEIIGSDTMLFPVSGIHEYDYTVIVNKKYKGLIKSDTVIVRTGLGHGDCGFVFTIGGEYLIYAVHENSFNYWDKKPNRSHKKLKGIYRTDICSRTTSLNMATDDIMELEK